MERGELSRNNTNIINMLRIRQKRRGVTFANPPAQASSSNSASRLLKTPPGTLPTPRLDKPKPKNARNSSVTASKRTPHHPSNAPTKVSNRQRRLASLFMALMASSSIPIEADAETIEAAQKATSAPKAPSDTKHRRDVSTVRVQEVRVGRWKRFRYELSLRTRRRKTERDDEVELVNLLEVKV